MLVAICLTIVFLSLLVLHVSVRYSKAGRLINKIPGPTPIPFLGNLLMFNIPEDKVWNKLIQLYEEYYPIIRIWGCVSNAVFIRHPDHVKAILSCKKNIEKSGTAYDGIRAIGNDGLVASGGEKWRHRRKMNNPAFNPSLLKIYLEIVNQHTEQLIRTIKNQNLEIIQNLESITSKLALAIICEATMGVDPNSSGTEKEKEFRHAADEFGEIIVYRSARPYIQNWMMKFLSAGRKLESVEKGLRGFVNMVIKKRREHYQTVGYETYQTMVNDVEDETSANPKKKLAVLDLLLAAEKDNLIDEKGIRSEVETIMFAGYDTTSLAVMFALMFLAENKDAQDLARTEVTEVLRQTEGVLTIADINKLEYLDRCIKETLRLCPTVPVIARLITDDIKLGKYEIPRGTEIFMSLYCLHRDPNFWPEPEKFDPDKFLPENVADRHPFAYVPFSAGLRSCIGYRFAMLEVKAIVARILYNFYLEPVDLVAKIQFQMHIVLKPNHPCRIKLISIDRD